MKIIETDLPGCLVIEPRVFGDDRGFFYESFNHDKLAAYGLQPAFVQGNVSSSTRGVLRGLHYQWPQAAGQVRVGASKARSGTWQSTSAAARPPSGVGPRWC